MTVQHKKFVLMRVICVLFPSIKQACSTTKSKIVQTKPISFSNTYRSAVQGERECLHSCSSPPPALPQRSEERATEGTISLSSPYNLPIVFEGKFRPILHATSSLICDNSISYTSTTSLHETKHPIMVCMMGCFFYRKNRRTSHCLIAV